MQIDRLRLVGFKSFADAAEVAIGPGLTAIVGPNGCGKSNLAEAVRWAMGENSARRLRGGAMDDVIFAGCATRPARNVAEVVLTLDNSAGDAPLAFDDRQEIEIVRRIDRGGGSAWRINGREARARDVQLLFADAGCGDACGAIVDQGRVGALIEAKPAERRALLDEAAGTAGLHARRRETELKLAAAEANLARLDDVIAALAVHLAALQKQARQAQRYRRLGEEIRRHEALLFLARWGAAESESENLAAELAAAERALTAAEAGAAAARRAREIAEAELPPLRRAAAEATAESQQLAQRRDALERELVQIVAARKEAERRLAELAADADREAASLADAEAALVRLRQERDRLSAAAAEDGPALAAAETRLAVIAARLAAAETGLQGATEAAAAGTAQRGALERQHRELAQRRDRLETRRLEAERQRAAAAAGAVPGEAVAAAAAALAAAEALAESCRVALEAAQRELAARQPQEAAALDIARRTGSRLSRLEAEQAALEAVLAPARNIGGEARVLSALHVAAGFEAAVGAAFEDALAASLDSEDDGAEQFWTDLGAIDTPSALPEGARALAEMVSAPPALSRRLAMAGWVEDVAAGRRLQRDLAPGQRLVGRDGALWRWDGFTRLSASTSGAAEHLRHRNRLTLLAGEIAAAADEARSAEAEAAAAIAARQAAGDAERLARLRLGEAERGLAGARAAQAELAHRALVTRTRLAAAADGADRLAAELAEMQAQVADAARELTALPEPGPARNALDAARAIDSELRREQTEARNAIDRATHEGQSRRARQSSIALEVRSWRGRADGSAGQSAILRERRRAIEAELAELAGRPAAIAARSETLGGEISAAAQHCRQTADCLARGESRLREAGEHAHRADLRAAQMHESRARLEVQSEGARQALAGLAREIGERIDVPPGALRELAGLALGQVPADAAATAARLARLTRERDGIGPINLVAESEAAELGARTDGLERERADLNAAIAKLRRAASALDQEGRQLLAAAFEQVNRHFCDLFAKLFAGGSARLALSEDGDPFAAGLEIMANPNGKRLQSLSLLSGGEQALTALALLFAVFLTRPAPVCVLDEVDAPLDDANVGRLCRLAAEIAASTGTRFLLVTHHRITMARADRLFGVTMAEPGVSQLVSVDLARPARLRRAG
jgi:chromosome segregation protein